MTECPHETLELSLGLTGVFCPECDRIWTVDFTRIRAGLEAALAVMPKPGGDEWEAKPVSGPAWEKSDIAASPAILNGRLQAMCDVLNRLSAENARLTARLAEAEREKVAAVKAEREACAQIADYGENAAAAIRARGEGET